MNSIENIAKAMPGAAPAMIAKRIVEDHASGAIDGATFAKCQQDLALSLHPDAPNVGVALQKFFDSAIGKSMLSAAATSGYERLQKATALGDGYDDVVSKADETAVDDDSEDGADTLDKAVSELARNAGITKSAAYDRLLREPEGQRLLAKSVNKSLSRYE